MRCINEKKLVSTTHSTRIFACDVNKLHNFELRAVGSVYLGDVDVSNKGLPLGAGASRGYTHEDFRAGFIEIYAIADTETYINIFGFIED